MSVSQPEDEQRTFLIVGGGKEGRRGEGRGKEGRRGEGRRRKGGGGEGRKKMKEARKEPRAGKDRGVVKHL